MRILTIVLALLFGVAQIYPALADPPVNKGHGNSGNAKGKGNAGNNGNAGGNGNNDKSQHVVIVDRDRTIIRQHFANGAAGGCPPGLAKKNNGCMPPGQARKLVMGQRVPADLVIYDLPPPLLVQLTPPPVGYRYARVGGEVALIAVQTHIVIDVFAF